MLKRRLLAQAPHRVTVLRKVEPAVRLEWLEQRLLFAGGMPVIQHDSPSFSDLQITYSGQAVTPGATTTSTSNGTDFGSAVQGGAAVTHTFTVKDVGSAELIMFDGNVELSEFSHATFTGPNASTSTELDLQPGQTGTFGFSMLTTSAGFLGDTFYLIYDGGVQVQFAISGYVAPKSTADLGTISSAPANDNSSVSVGSGTDSNGNHPIAPQDRTLHFHLNEQSTITFDASATAAAASQGTADMAFLLARLQRQRHPRRIRSHPAAAAKRDCRRRGQQTTSRSKPAGRRLFREPVGN